MSKEELSLELEKLKKQLEIFKQQGLSLNMSRGKPDKDQLDLSLPMLDTVTSTQNYIDENGVDCRNYGELTGLMGAKKLFAEYMGCAADEIIITGSSSLALMYDCITRAMLTGVLGSEKPWVRQGKIKFLCPVPGYDRHFSICQFLDIEMIPVATTHDGPDMDTIEKLTANDALIKGIWIVPIFSNPLGITYSNNTILRLAALKPAAKDFRIFCDNAYALHKIYRDVPQINILQACKEAGNPNMVYLFGSTNKVTFPGAGVAFLASSKENTVFTTKQLSMQAIGWDKLNMLRHVRFLKNFDGIKTHMEKQSEFLRPKFDAVLNKLETNIKDVGNWIQPDGGYFITFIAQEGCAKRIVALCKGAGVIMTDAGATHPYGIDPEDRYIRIAPTFPSLDELNKAMDIFCTAVKLAAVEKAAG